MLSIRFIIVFLLGALALAWILPSSWIEQGTFSILPEKERSVFAGSVSIEDVAWGNGSPYVRISVKSLDAPLSLSEWSLENTSGNRVEIGLGIESYAPGSIPRPAPILVASNTSIIASFGPSPIGVSFREHVCSAYLRGTSPVTPPMASQCPDVSLSPEWNGLDATCRLLLSSLPRCEVVSPEHVGDVSPLCDAFLRTVPTHETCMEEAGANAFLSTWRVFLGNTARIITSDGGVVSLLDDRGRLVDTFEYQTIGLQ